MKPSPFCFALVLAGAPFASASSPTTTPDSAAIFAEYFHYTVEAPPLVLVVPGTDGAPVGVTGQNGGRISGDVKGLTSRFSQGNYRCELTYRRGSLSGQVSAASVFIDPFPIQIQTEVLSREKFQEWEFQPQRVVNKYLRLGLTYRIIQTRFEVSSDSLSHSPFGAARLNVISRSKSRTHFVSADVDVSYPMVVKDTDLWEVGVSPQLLVGMGTNIVESADIATEYEGGPRIVDHVEGLTAAAMQANVGLLGWLYYGRRAFAWEAGYRFRHEFRASSTQRGFFVRLGFRQQL